MVLTSLSVLAKVALMYWVVILGTGLIPSAVVQYRNNAQNNVLPSTNCTTKSCGRCLDMSSSGGIIQSSFFPQYYGFDFTCVYTITVEEGKRIQLNFTTFFVVDTVDVLIIYDGPISTDLVNAININGYLLNPVMTSTTNQVNIEFISYGDGTYTIPAGKVPSWEAIYTVVD